jgi:ribosomal protein S6--L-glutamate ligase
VTRPISLGLLLIRHPPNRASPVMPEVVGRLRERGARVAEIYPDSAPTDLGRLEIGHDLYVLKSGSETALSLAGALHARGAPILNPYPVSAVCRDKAVLTSYLRGTGVPVPETYLAADRAQLSTLLQDGPIILKPARGSQGRGVHVVTEGSELVPDAAGDGSLLAQRYHAPLGRDRKLYRIGDDLFGVKRRWPAGSYEQKLGDPFPVGDDLREIALRCGDAFGIDLYGLDVIETDRGPFVVDFSSFPGFKGVPDAARRLADYLWRAAHQARNRTSGIADRSALIGAR